MKPPGDVDAPGSAEDFTGTFGPVYAGRSVLLTGHTGFMGGWLTLWLSQLGARVAGYSLPPPTTPSIFAALGLEQRCASHEIGDVRDAAKLEACIARTEPEVVFHLAAQPLVRASYDDPLGTVATNVIGTVNLLDALRRRDAPCIVVVVTTDKCYENREWLYAYREVDHLGGHDLYSASKAAADLLTTSYARAFFAERPDSAVTTVRVGNVIGGGDWARDRLVPDAVRAISAGETVALRNPHAIRPWQHVLEPLGGYLLLGARLLEGDAATRARLAGPWNFGPWSDASRPVGELVSELLQIWGQGQWRDVSDMPKSHEASTLRLAIDKAVALLDWSPRWTLRQSLEATVAWYRAFYAGQPPKELLATSLEQIATYQAAGGS